MKLWRCPRGAVSLAAALCVLPGLTDAAEFQHLDGVHRIEKVVQVTQRAVLEARKDAKDVCGTSMQLCPESLDGGCCPNNYDCAKKSCYMTTRGPSTCGGRRGWYGCQPDVGGGCCPEGYACKVGGDCVPPSGVSYTYDCPASHFLCPASLNYGCCPDGMGCAVNQCYSTKGTTITTEVEVTTTKDGHARTYTTKTTSVKKPDVPTELPTADANADDSQQNLLKYFPSSIPKETEISSSDDSGGGGGLSKGQLAGIVTGAVAGLVLVLVAAYIILRRLNKVSAELETSKQSSSTAARPPMHEFKPTDSEVDAFSVDPLMMTPQPQNANMRTGSTPGAVSSTDETPSSFAGAYQRVSTNDSRHASWDGNGQMVGYFDSIPDRNARFSNQSTAPYNRVSVDSNGSYQHLRHWSNASEDSTPPGGVPASTGAATELEARSVVPELPGSPGEENRHRSNSNNSLSGFLTRSPPAVHQRMRSGSAMGHELGVVNEEMHGFHGPTHHVAGQTSPEPSPGDQMQQ